MDATSTVYERRRETYSLLWAVKWITSAVLNNALFEVDSKVVTLQIV